MTTSNSGQLNKADYTFGIPNWVISRNVYYFENYEKENVMFVAKTKESNRAYEFAIVGYDEKLYATKIWCAKSVYVPEFNNSQTKIISAYELAEKCTKIPEDQIEQLNPKFWQIGSTKNLYFKLTKNRKTQNTKYHFKGSFKYQNNTYYLYKYIHPFEPQKTFEILNQKQVNGIAYNMNTDKYEQIESVLRQIKTEHSEIKSIYFDYNNSIIFRTNTKRKTYKHVPANTTPYTIDEKEYEECMIDTKMNFHFDNDDQHEQLFFIVQMSLQNRIVSEIFDYKLEYANSKKDTIQDRFYKYLNEIKSEFLPIEYID